MTFLSTRRRLVRILKLVVKVSGALTVRTFAAPSAKRLVFELVQEYHFLHKCQTLTVRNKVQKYQFLNYISMVQKVIVVQSLLNVYTTFTLQTTKQYHLLH